MTPRDLRNIHTTGNSCRDALPCANMALKLPRYFYLLMGEASWSLLPSSVSLLSGSTVQPENTYSCILKVTGQVWENQKRISTTLITIIGIFYCLNYTSLLLDLIITHLVNTFYNNYVINICSRQLL